MIGIKSWWPRWRSSLSPPTLSQEGVKGHGFVENYDISDGISTSNGISASVRFGSMCP